MSVQSDLGKPVSAGCAGFLTHPPALAGNTHPFENPPFGVGSPLGLLGLSGCSLGGCRFSATTGIVESAAKQLKARFTGPGMRWSRSGVERLLPVRAAIMGHRFDELWPEAYSSPPT